MTLAALVGSALILSATATAERPDASAKQLAQQRCKAEKQADKQAFKSVYGKHAMRTCGKGTKSAVQAELRNAAKQCKAERAEDPDGFALKYGSEQSRGKNALGKCVSSVVKAAEEVEPAEM